MRVSLVSYKPYYTNHGVIGWNPAKLSSQQKLFLITLKILAQYFFKLTIYSYKMFRQENVIR